jgi:hypothetical protein
LIGSNLGYINIRQTKNMGFDATCHTSYFSVYALTKNNFDGR